MRKVSCLIVGAGYMAEEYLKVLNYSKIEPVIIGKGHENIKKITQNFNVKAFSGGLENFNFEQYKFSHAIVAVSVQNLFNITCILIKNGIKNILVEKPACLNMSELKVLEQLSQNYKSTIYIAYNRRFYSSIQKLKEKIIEEGGVQLVNFEFTEWIHTIDQNKFPIEVLNKFFIANSTHVVDTVFDIIGKPITLKNLVIGSNISWHPAGSIFIGFGSSIYDIPFSYSTNWSSAGRWAIEVITKKNRYYLKPMEKLFVQNNGSVEIKSVEIQDEIDNKFKPGIYKMVEEFFSNTHKNLCSLEQHKNNFSFYEKIAGYNK